MTGNSGWSETSTSLGLTAAADKRRYLEELQEQTTRAMIPAMTYLAILATVGLVGNSLVLFVYSRKFQQTSTRVFIMAIATFDIVANVIAIPGEIYDMFHLWDFDQPLVCKVRLYFNAFTTMVAAMVLVAVAVVRYRKICKPFQKQVTIKMAKIISVALAIASLIFSVPYAVINGRQTKQTPLNHINGSECTIDDSYVGTIWPMMNGAFFIFLFVSCSIPLVVMYILIGLTAWKHSRVHGVGVYTKGKQDIKASDSSNSTEPGTKSTDDKALQFAKSPRSRSFVKIKGDSQSEQQPEDGNVDKGTVGNKRGSNDKSNAPECNGNNHRCGDDANDGQQVESFNATGRPGVLGRTKSDGDCPVRVLRSQTGHRVEVNLSMVQELTAKLRAVKKDSERRSNRKKEENQCQNDGPDSIEVEDNNKQCQNYNYRDEGRDSDNGDDIPFSNEKGSLQKNEKRFTKLRRQQKINIEDSQGQQEDNKSSASHSRRLSKSLGDLSRLTESISLGKDLAKMKSAEHEDINLHEDTTRLLDCQEDADNEKPTSPKDDEPISEFARAMMWVDLTYSAREEAREAENTKADGSGDEPDGNSLTKKGSFAIGRKISRDNSFLQRHKKLKDALTDTLTRARKSKKDRETAEGEARENNGFVRTMENINSESENTGSCEGNETDYQRKKSFDVQHIEKIHKQKGSRQEEGSKGNEFGNRVRVDTQRPQRRPVSRTTAMLVLISAVYILGFLPYLGLMFAKSYSPKSFEDMDTVSLAVYNLFLRSFFLNCAANPIIYSLCDVNFRRECISLLKCR